MNRRFSMFVLSAAALVIVGTGAIVSNGVFAQESTPEAEGTPAVGSDAETETSAYDEFVAGLAANLGISDPATVDTAIKETLKQRVDEQLAAGEISANEATARKERIDAGEFGRFFFGRGDRDDDRGGHDGRDDRGEQDDSDTGEEDDSDTSTEASPTETPAT